MQNFRNRKLVRSKKYDHVVTLWFDSAITAPPDLLRGAYTPEIQGKLFLL